VDQRDFSLRGHDKNAKFRCRIVSRWFIGIGLVLVLIGLLWPWLGRLSARRHRGRAGEFPFLFPDRNLPRRQRSRIADLVALEAMRLSEGM